MTNQQIHIAFKMVLDKNADSISFGGAPAFLPAEIDYFLNQALYEVIFNKVNGTNARSVPFEGDKKRLADLQNLIVSEHITTGVFNTENEFGTALGYIGFSGKTAQNPRGTRLIPVSTILVYNNVRHVVTLISHEQSERFVNSAINKPWIPSPTAVLQDDNLVIIIDSDMYQADADKELYLTYIKVPQQINYVEAAQEYVDLQENVLMEVINRAVVLALENIQSERTAAKLQLNNISE